MRIIPRSEWGARYGDGKHWRDLPATEAWLHHSVTVAPDTGAALSEGFEAIQAVEQIGAERFGETYGFPYTFAITPSGRIYAGHHVGKTGAHTAGHNRVGIGIVFIGNYEEQQPTEAQLDSCAWLLNEAHRQGWLAQPRLNGGHRDTKATACPGIHAYNRIDEINRRVEEDDMPSAKEIVDELLNRDVVEVPWEVEPGGNTTFKVRNALESIWHHSFHGWGDIVPARYEEDGTNWQWLGKNALGTTVKQSRRIEQTQAQLLEAVKALGNGDPIEVDEDAIVDGVLSGLTPERIAAGIPDELAQQVVDALGERLGSEEES